MKQRFVLDASLAVACCLGEPEADGSSEAVIDALVDGEALVPGIWPAEVSNVIVKHERRGRLSAAQADDLFKFLADLPVTVFAFDASHTFGRLAALARRRTLSVYDAEYLELALQSELPLATLDEALRRAARSEKVPLFQG